MGGRCCFEHLISTFKHAIRTLVFTSYQRRGPLRGVRRPMMAIYITNQASPSPRHGATDLRSRKKRSLERHRPHTDPRPPANQTRTFFFRGGNLPHACLVAPQLPPPSASRVCIKADHGCSALAAAPAVERSRVCTGCRHRRSCRAGFLQPKPRRVSTSQRPNGRFRRTADEKQYAACHAIQL